MEREKHAAGASTVNDVARPMKILMVEDNPEHAMLVRTYLMLRDTPYDITVKESGEDALDHIDAAPPEYDIIFVDHMLPGMTGIDVIGEMKEKGLDVPIIMITSQGSIKVAVEAMKLGAYDYVVKDEDYFKTLYMVVDTAIKRYNLDKRNRELQEELLVKNRELTEANEKLLTYQRQIIQSEKMASLVTLVKGISHEMNNPLTGILGFTQLLLSTSDDAPLRDDLREIEKNALRCREIVSKLSKFCHTDMASQGEIDLGEMMDDSISFIEGTIEEHRIVVKKEVAGGVPTLKGSRQDFQQAFLAILMNAVQAMRDGGTLTTRVLSDGPGEVAVEIADTGVGIPPENIEKIFTPFFTTRGVGEGFGLGLSVTYGIVKEYQGKIEVESEPGKGSTFRLRFPVQRDRVADN